MYTWFKESAFVVKTLSNLFLVSKICWFILFCSCFILTYIHVQHQEKILFTLFCSRQGKGLSTLCCKHFSFFPLRLKYHSNWSCQLLLKQAVYRPLFPRLYLLAFFASRMMETVQPTILSTECLPSKHPFFVFCFCPLISHVFCYGLEGLWLSHPSLMDMSIT